MSVWKQGKNERFHDKKIWSQYTDAGLSTALNIEIGSCIYARKTERWIPDTRRGWGMIRENPIIRYSSEKVVFAMCHGCYDRHELLFVSWNQIPQEEDTMAYADYQKDAKHPGFLGISKSGSAVKTATMNWMKVN